MLGKNLLGNSVETTPKMGTKNVAAQSNYLRIASFNCEGFNDQKQMYIKNLLTNVDIILLQEFWLIPSALNKLTTLSDQFQCSAVSGVDDTEI